MKIGGIAPFTTIDFPDTLAAVLFCQGCPWRCVYCHNPHLQPCSKESIYEWPRIMSFLKKRQGFLEAVVISGGEPTQQPDLIDAIKDMRSLKYKVGLHTAGMYPSVLKDVLPLIDWIGMDIKAPFDDYERITHIPQSGQAAKISAKQIIDSRVPYEFRTTVHPELLSSNDLMRIVSELNQMGAKNYALQHFRSQGCENESLKLFSQPIFDEIFINHCKNTFQTFLIRD